MHGFKDRPRDAIGNPRAGLIRRSQAPRPSLAAVPPCTSGPTFGQQAAPACRGSAKAAWLRRQRPAWGTSHSASPISTPASATSIPKTGRKGSLTNPSPRLPARQEPSAHLPRRGADPKRPVRHLGRSGPGDMLKVSETTCRNRPASCLSGEPSHPQHRGNARFHGRIEFRGERRERPPTSRR
jgi:hypothetical protein